MDMAKYRELFVSETGEYLRSMGESIIALENDPGNREQIDALFRHAHSIKGMAASMEYHSIAELAHRMEDLMDRVRHGVFPFSPAIADLLLEGADTLESMLADVAQDQVPTQHAAGLLDRLSGYQPPEPAQSAPASAEAPEETIPLAEPPEAKQEQAGEHQEHFRTVRIRTELLDRLINHTGELLTTKERLKNVAGELASPRLTNAIEDLAKELRELHIAVQNIRLLPFSSICDRFPRVVRDLAKKSGKDVMLEIEGKEIQLDRAILEGLADPLIHILRNAVDHGIESPEKRGAAGKDHSGRVVLAARREKDQIVVTVEDDGNGMDPAQLIATAVAKGMLRQERAKAMTPGEALMLTCLPGFSTAREVTEVSGRGVGMDAVLTAIKTIGGTLSITSEPGRGTAITLKLPLTIAIIHVMLISCGELTFGVPLNKISRILELERSALVTRGKKKVFFLEDEEIPLLSLNRVLGIPSRLPARGVVPTVVTEVRGRRAGLAIDRFIGQQEVYIKDLGRPLNRMKGLAGGAMIGDGQIILLLDVANLL
ncbi:MAG: chemotaxis protein CheA [Geobacter sp.]|nr:chemotaxis protein CheA [Geobacter sp.]